MNHQVIAQHLVGEARDPDLRVVSDIIRIEMDRCDMPFNASFLARVVGARRRRRRVVVVVNKF